MTLARSFDALGRLNAYPTMTELAEGLDVSERRANGWLRDLAGDYAHPFEGWRDLVHESRIEWATQLLSLPDLPVREVARVAGHRSGVALAHAFSMRGAPAPTAIAREHARRWR